MQGHTMGNQTSVKCSEAHTQLHDGALVNWKRECVELCGAHVCKCTRGRLVRKRRCGGGKERWACAKRKARMGHESSVIQRYKILI